MNRTPPEEDPRTNSCGSPKNQEPIPKVKVPGSFVCDVCYYYGDQGANFVPPKHIDPSLGYGYDYDVVNPEVILNRMTARNGRITLPDGMQYELLVLPQRPEFDLEVLRKIEQLVKAGATVVGPKPNRSNGLTDYPARDRKVQQLADLLWGDCDGQTTVEHRYGEGRVIWGRPLRGILRQRGVEPDSQFWSDRDDSQFDFIHRHTGAADIYFVRNMTSRAESVTATFRVSGKAPELWLPDSVILKNLVAWTDHEHEGIKYFSGIATYETTLGVPESWLESGKEVYLDLGSLWAVGSVRLNGESLGVLSKPPYRVNLTKAARSGENRLEVEVANTWANRLVGDTHLPEGKRFCQTNITRSGIPSKPWKEIPLRESGLLGPVQLIPAVERTISMSEYSVER